MTATADVRDCGAARRGSFLSIRQLSPEELTVLVTRSVRISEQPDSTPRCLDRRIVATLFEKTSTRTRTAFSAAALRLGAQLVNYGPDSLQLSTGESLQDTARILGMMLDGVVIRTTRTVGELATMVNSGGPALINAMTLDEHPTQAVSDLAMLTKHFGAVDGLSVLYVGEGNNTASALAFALARIPTASLTVYAPPGYGLPEEQLRLAATDAVGSGARIRQVHQPDCLPDNVDVVYTTRWQTTGTVKDDPEWRESFRPFHIDRSFLDRWPDAVFMHDLPAHRGEEVSGAVLDCERSLVWSQARMKLFNAMALLERFWGDS